MRVHKQFIPAFALALAFHATAFAQHDHSDLEIGSSASGGGDLIVEYPFSELPVVRVTDSGFPGLFTSTDPGFTPALDEAPDLFELSLGTEVDFEITDIDPGISLQMGMTLLENVGDTATIGTHDFLGDPESSSLHQHPTFQLLLSAPGDTFAEGRFSFKLREGSSGVGYGDSEIHTLKLSNGYLPGLEGAATIADVNCRKAVALEVRKLTAEVYRRLGLCLDRITLAEELGKSEKAARKACEVNTAHDSKGVAGRIETAVQKAIGRIEKKCGTLTSSSEPYTQSAINTHLGMASCRAQELAGATYENARDEIAHILGECHDNVCVGGPEAGNACTTDEDCDAEEAVEEALPCLLGAAGE